MQKLCSVSASMATFYFNKIFQENVKKLMQHSSSNENYLLELEKCTMTPAMFDARCFNIPKEEVVNLIYWRQLDAIRNSI